MQLSMPSSRDWQFAVGSTRSTGGCGSRGLEGQGSARLSSSMLTHNARCVCISACTETRKRHALLNRQQLSRSTRCIIYERLKEILFIPSSHFYSIIVCAPGMCLSTLRLLPLNPGIHRWSYQSKCLAHLIAFEISSCYKALQGERGTGLSCK